MSLELELLTPKEVADLFKVSKRTVERLNLPYIKVGRLRRYPKAKMLEYLEQRSA